MWHNAQKVNENYMHFFLACILLLNSTVLAVPVENTSAQSTFSSTLTREPISKITDGEIQSSDIEIVKKRC